VCKGEFHLLLQVPGFSFAKSAVSQLWPEPQVKMRHKWRQFNDLAIKTVAHSQPCGDTLSQKNLNCLNLAICFSENRPFSPDFGGSCRLLAIFRPKKNHWLQLRLQLHTVDSGAEFLIQFFQK
jgi:hypothetical protein